MLSVFKRRYKRFKYSVINYPYLNKPIMRGTAISFSSKRGKVCFCFDIKMQGKSM